MSRLSRLPTRCAGPILAAAVMSAGCARDGDGLDVSMYTYRDTRELVGFVRAAASEVEAEGRSALERFGDSREDYHSGDSYLYVYDMDGVNIFHAGMPYLEGECLRETRDVNGKCVFDLVLQAVDDPDNRHGWVHYVWWEPGSFYPVPKSSCHFAVVTPDGEELIVGGGLDYPLEEKEFIRIVVDDAVSMIETEGPTAIDSIDDPRSRFVFRDVRVFAFRPGGDIVISPIVADSTLEMDLMASVDLAGNRPFELAVGQLAEADSVWQVFLARDRYQRQPVKKVLYLSRTELGGDTLFVGAVTDLPMTP